MWQVALTQGSKAGKDIVTSTNSLWQRPWVNNNLRYDQRELKPSVSTRNIILAQSIYFQTFIRVTYDPLYPYPTGSYINPHLPIKVICDPEESLADVTGS